VAHGNAVEGSATHEIGLCGALSRYMTAYDRAEMMKALPKPGESVRCAHNQSFDPLEPEAGVARTLVEFHPRRAPFA